MRRESYRLDGNPRPALLAIKVQLGRFCMRGIQWDFAQPMFVLIVEGGREIAVYTIEYHDDETWSRAHPALCSRGLRLED